jgi:predicted esterase
MCAASACSGTTAGMEQADEPPRSGSSLPALDLPSPFLDLAVARHRPAVVSVPLGATDPRPVLVAAHGAGDRPEWQCQFWRAIVEDRAFVLCPRGFPLNSHVPPEQTGYFYPTHHALGREVSEALRALAARFPQHADIEAPVYAGFSQGAIMGALLLPQHPARFARAVLIEGGAGQFQEWNRLVAAAWKGRGGQRALLVCGRDPCAAAAEASAGYLRKEGLEARVVLAPGAGHTYGGTVGDEVARAFAWVVEQDARF